MEHDRMKVFLESLEPKSSDVITQLRQEAMETHVPIIRRDTESLLRFLVKSHRPRRILEVGCAIGYSAICMWEEMPAESVIDTIENYEKRIPIARENFRRAGCEARVNLLAGDATEILPKLAEERAGGYDLIFMDAAKGQYIVWLESVLKLLSPGGILIGDNVLQGGDVCESRFVVTRRNRTIHSRMREYLYVLKHTEGLTTTILDIGDGVTLSCKEGETCVPCKACLQADT